MDLESIYKSYFTKKQFRKLKNLRNIWKYFFVFFEVKKIFRKIFLFKILNLNFFPNFLKDLETLSFLNSQFKFFSKLILLFFKNSFKIFNLKFFILCLLHHCSYLTQLYLLV